MTMRSSRCCNALRWSPFVAVLVLVGCLGDEPRTVQPKPAPAVFVPEQFTDISLPKGYMFTPGEDQLAVSLANGSIRRFEVVLEQRPSAQPQPPDELLFEMERDLQQRGWEKVKSSGLSQQYNKKEEQLLLETGRSGGRTTIRLRLRPLQAVGP